MKRFTGTSKSFNIEFQPLIEEMNTKEEVVSKCASLATMDKIRGMILHVLDTIPSTKASIQRSKVLCRVLHYN